MYIRRPAVAGQFYDSDVQSLKKSIEGCFLHRLGPGKEPPSSLFEDVLGVVVPHAGFMYSGPVAAHGYYACSALDDVDLVVVLGPNHWSTGSGVSTMRDAVWMTPLGKVEVDSEAAKSLSGASQIVDFDEEAHRQEHSIEVQIPFLQYIYGRSFKILPICMLMQDEETATEVGRALSAATEGRRSLIVASSDFSHYEDQKIALSKDQELIDAIMKLDVERFYNTIERLNASVCGYGPIAALMTAMRESRGLEGRLLKYATSGDMTCDYSSVVGYASMVFTKEQSV